MSMLASPKSNPTRVLTADLTWTPIETLDVGQPVITFDETPRSAPT